MVNTRGNVLVLDLSNPFDISEVTIHADLRLLEGKGLLTRLHGGATHVGSDLTDTESQEMVPEDRYQLTSDSEKHIAQATAAMIREGMTVILDSGSTTLLIAEALARMTNTIVITSSLPVAFTLTENKDITLVVCGGTVQHKTHFMHGTITERSLRGICADLMFVGADGIDATNDIITFNEGYPISNVTATVAHQVIAVLDAGKFSRRDFNQVLSMEKIGCIIINGSISEGGRAVLGSEKMELKIVWLHAEWSTMAAGST